MSCEYLAGITNIPYDELPETCKGCVERSKNDPLVEKNTTHGDFGDEFTIEDVQLLSKVVMQVGGALVLKVTEGATNHEGQASIYSVERTPVACTQNPN